MSFTNSKTLQEELNKIGHDIQKMVVECRQAGVPLNSEQQASFDKLEAEYTRKEQEKQGFERMERWDAATVRSAATPSVSATPRANEINAVKAVISRIGGWDCEQRWDEDSRFYGAGNQSMTLRYRDKLPQNRLECRALTTVASGHGTEFVPTTLGDQIYQKTLAFGGLLEKAYKFSTDNGAPFDVPTSDNTAVIGALVVQGEDDSTVDLNTSKKSFSSYTISSGIQLVTREMTRDGNGFDLQSWLVENLGTACGRKIAALLVTGTGSSQPQGILPSGGLSSAFTTASATDITYAELIDLLHSVDSSYWDGSAFYVGVAARKYLMKMLDDNNRPLWQPAFDAGLAGGAPATLLGFPCFVETGLEAVAATKKPIVFGNMSKALYVRLVGGIEIAESKERYFEKRSAAIAAYIDMDSDVINASAAKYITMHA